MTSNLGAGAAKRGIGFTATEAIGSGDHGRMLAAAKAAFLPEFLNRIDEIVSFKALERDQVERITALMVARVADRLRAERGIELAVDDALVQRLARDGFDEEFGARPLQRHVRRTLEKALTRAILAGEIVDGDRVEATGDADGGIVLAARHAEPALA
jgi:ATP-dependent Clp protease ATP-binding subunit ClpC